MNPTLREDIKVLITTVTGLLAALGSIFGAYYWGVPRTLAYAGVGCLAYLTVWGVLTATLRFPRRTVAPAPEPAPASDND